MPLTGAINLHPAAYSSPGAVRYVPISLASTDADLTDPAGPSGGYCARWVVVGGSGGNVVVCCLDGTDNVTVPVQANTTVPLGVAKIYKVGTTATVSGVEL